MPVAPFRLRRAEKPGVSMFFRSIVTTFCALCYPAAVSAADSIEGAAEKLVAATVPVRVAAVADKANRDANDAKGASGVDTKQDSAARSARDATPANVGEVTVCSGVSLGKGLIVTFHAMPPATARMPRVRVTLAGGEQAEAELRLVDRHSGLV